MKQFLNNELCPFIVEFISGDISIDCFMDKYNTDNNIADFL